MPGDNTKGGFFNTMTPRQLPEDEDDLGPCASRPGNKFLTCLHIHDGPKPVVSFQYSAFGVRSVFEPGRFMVSFADANERWRVVVHGRNLWNVYNHCCQHRLEFIRVADRDFGEDDKKPVITQVDVQQVSEGQPLLF